jgi:hypothetical protein
MHETLQKRENLDELHQSTRCPVFPSFYCPFRNPVYYLLFLYVPYEDMLISQSSIYVELDAMQDALQKMTTALVQVIQTQSQAQMQAPPQTLPASGTSYFVQTPSISVPPPPSLITPSIPAPALETLPDLEVEDTDDYNGSSSKSLPEQTKVTRDGQMRSSVFESLGKLFYLRS